MGMLKLGNTKAAIRVNEVGAAPLTESGKVHTGPVAFAGLMVQTDGTNDVVINVYDAVTAAGKKVVPTALKVPGSQESWGLNIDPPLLCDNGIYVEITCSGSCSVVPIYDAG